MGDPVGGTAGGTARGDSGNSWLWLFPASYLAHIAEEYWGGESFSAWASRTFEVDFTIQDFLVLNGIFLLAMIAAVAFITLQSRLRWMAAALATVVLVNGLLHLIGTALTRTYSPGVVTGVLVWIPLGAATLVVWRRHLTPSALGLGIVVGLVLQGAIALIAFGAS